MAPPIVAIPNTWADTMKQTIWTNVTQYVKYGLHITNRHIDILFQISLSVLLASYPSPMRPDSPRDFGAI